MNNCIQTAYDFTITSDTVSVTFADPVTSGNIITVSVPGGSVNTGIVVSVTDSLGTVYARKTPGVNWVEPVVFQGIAPSSGVCTVTFTATPFYEVFISPLISEWSSYTQVLSATEIPFPVGGFIAVGDNPSLVGGNSITVLVGVPFYNAPDYKIQDTASVQMVAGGRGVGPLPLPANYLNITCDVTTLPPGITSTIVPSKLYGSPATPGYLPYSNFISGTPYAFVLFSGTPTTPGTYNVKISFTDAAGEIYYFNYQIGVEGVMPVVIPNECCCCCVPIKNMSSIVSGGM